MSLESRSLAILASFLFFALAATAMFAPDPMRSNGNAARPHPAELLGRRAAALYTGFGIMLLLARSAEQSPALTALAAGMVTACFLRRLACSNWQQAMRGPESSRTLCWKSRAHRLFFSSEKKA